MKWTKKSLEREIVDCFNIYFNRVPIPIGELTKIKSEAETRILAGEDSEFVMMNISQRYKKEPSYVS